MASRRLLSPLLVLALSTASFGQQGHEPSVIAPGAKNVACSNRPIPQLEDAIAATRITFKHEFVREKRYITESMGGGLLIIDYDRDGWQDIYFTNNPSVEQELKKHKVRGALYRNNQDGTFTDVTDKAGVATPGYAMGGAVGDYNNDGWPDMYITCLGGNVLYRNNGNGTFTDVTKHAGVAEGRWSSGAAFGDYDLDGFLDLAVVNYVDFRLDDLPGFGSAPTCKYRGIDVQCGPRGLPGAGDSLFRNNGDGTFAEVGKKLGAHDPDGFYGLGIMWADFEMTGRPDLYVGNDSTPNFLYKNLGGGKFAEVGMESGTSLSDDGSEQGTMGIAIGDYLHNGRPGIYITNFADQYNTLYRNDGDYNFRDVSFSAGVAIASLPWVKWGTAFVDLDNDGWLDLLNVSGHVYPQMDELPTGARYLEPGVLLFNQKDGTFCDALNQGGKALQQPRASRGLAVVDLDNNGVQDIIVEDLDGLPMILRNSGIPGQHWIKFELQGTKSNRLAIGARVKLVGGGMTQTAEVHSGGSYLSQHDLRIHFGLGASTKINSVEIRWPSGAVETIAGKDLKADQIYSVLEGKGLVPAEMIRPGKESPKASPGGAGK